MGTKTCVKCNQTKDLTFFARNKAKKDGLQSYCKDCNIQTQKERYKNNKAYYKDKAKVRTLRLAKKFSEYKKSLYCKFCKESTSCCLDFHHIDKDTKVETISYLSKHGSFDSLTKELEKCVVLCANCHRKLHAGLIDIHSELV